MEKHILFVLGLIIICYVGMGGLLFQRVEQPQMIKFDYMAMSQPEPIAIFNISEIIAESLGAKQLQLEEPTMALPTNSVSLIRTGNNDSNFLVSKDTSKNCPDLVQQIALRIAQFVIEEIAPRNLRGVPIFNTSLGNKGDGRQLFLTKTPQLYEDWDFYGSVFFAATTITTIGYGHVAPQTEFGKIAVVIYALVGIPLVAAFLGGLSDRIRQMAEHLQDRVPVGKNGKYEPHPRRRNGCAFCCVAMMKIVLVTLIGASIFIAMPSLLFYWKEQNWTYIEAMYFSFVTLSTIGFGDYIAARNPDIEGLEWYRIFVVVWIFLGLAWLSSVIALIQAAITNYSAIAINHAMLPKVKTTVPDNNQQIAMAETSLDRSSSNDSENPRMVDPKEIAVNQTQRLIHQQRRPKNIYAEPAEYSVPMGRKSGNRVAATYNEYDSASFTSLDELNQRVPSTRRGGVPYYHANKRPSQRHGASMQGLVSVAAATASSQGEKLAMAANQAIDHNNDDLQVDYDEDQMPLARTLQPPPKPRSTRLYNPHHQAPPKTRVATRRFKAADMSSVAPLVGADDETSILDEVEMSISKPTVHMLPFVDDQRYRKTKLAIHSSLSNTSRTSDQKTNENAPAAVTPLPKQSQL